MKRFNYAVALLVLAPLARAEEPKLFPAAKHGKGELKYIDKVPVLVVKGKPAEIGEQFGKLAVANAPDLGGLHAQFLKDIGQEKRYPFLAALSAALKPGFPAHIATEVETAAKVSDRELSLLLFANTVADLTSGMGCSTVIVEKDRSKTGSPIFGATSTGSPPRASPSTRWSSSTRARGSGPSPRSQSARSRASSAG